MLGFAGTAWVVDSGLFLAALLLAACSALGQAVTDIETRGIDPSYPADYNVRTAGTELGAPTTTLYESDSVFLAVAPHQLARRTTTK